MKKWEIVQILEDGGKVGISGDSYFKVEEGRLRRYESGTRKPASWEVMFSMAHLLAAIPDKGNFNWAFRQIRDGKTVRRKRVGGYRYLDADDLDAEDWTVVP